ncbi:uncharacterized protein LOC128997222 isoform X1 [Macrosteles quadrilineatus]|uniref:uncharacterized protein LOC128997222 isoform X1 n=1 Tax=Macrosteles quadrilineatus TaxID=74068 RepID=UPI0023E187D3|nr:uncharacterized protein LOC128997222 isoform X1 [Macrosteles quadrilineatus]
MAKSISLFLSRSLMTVKPHVPMIKFRKGGSPQKHAEAGHSSSPPVVHAAPQSKAASGRVVSRPIIEDYQLPARYRRHGLDQAEIDAINSGGAF